MTDLLAKEKLIERREKLSAVLSKRFPAWRGRNFSLWREWATIGKTRVQKNFVYFGKRTIKSKGFELTSEEEQLFTEYANLATEIEEIV